MTFLFGWLFHYVLTVYWMYTLKEFRGAGNIHALFERLEQDLRAKDCYKIEMYAYAGHQEFLDLGLKLGFEKGVLIEKSMFGFKIQNTREIHRRAGPGQTRKEDQDPGRGRPGDQAPVPHPGPDPGALGNEVSLSVNYDASVRGGNISADLIYSDVTIQNPLIDEADILIKFTRKREWFPAKALIIDEGFCDEGAISCSIKSSHGTLYGFEDVAITVFGNKVFINMIALGRILRYIGVSILLLDFKGLLPQRSQQKNFEAVKYGFNFHDDI